MKKIVIHFLAVFVLFTGQVYAQSVAETVDLVRPRMRVIVDNDFGGDPDGLFQLAAQLLAPSNEVRAVICSHHYENWIGHAGNVAYAREQVERLLDVMGMPAVPVYSGSDESFRDTSTPLESEGARIIVEEAMRDERTPLYVVCGAGLTNIAAAYLMEPAIAERIEAVVWIGGSEYPELCRTQVQSQREYNLGIDPIAAQVVFNHSALKLWQIPRDVYRQTLYSHAEMVRNIASTGPVGAYLVSTIEEIMRRTGGRMGGEVYILGDSPLVLVTALQSFWERDPASCEYVVRPCPQIDDAGFYVDHPDGRPIRIYTKLDTRLMFGDFAARLALYEQRINVR